MSFYFCGVENDCKLFAGLNFRGCDFPPVKRISAPFRTKAKPIISARLPVLAASDVAPSIQLGLVGAMTSCKILYTTNNVK